MTPEQEAAYDRLQVARKELLAAGNAFASERTDGAWFRVLDLEDECNRLRWVLHPERPEPKPQKKFPLKRSA